MATIGELTTLYNELVVKVNAIINNSKSISNLTQQVTLDTSSEIAVNGGKKVTIQQIIDKSIADFDISETIAYTSEELETAIRKTIEPYKLVTYLPTESPYTTASIVASTPTKILLSTTQKTINGFTLSDLGGGNMAYKYTGSGTNLFDVNMVTGIKSGTNNAVIILEIYKNGVKETGLSSTRKISSTDVGNLNITGEISLTTNDYIELYVTTDLTSTYTFSRTSINICERN